MIKAEKLTYDSIVDALLKGNFYSSMGPEIKELYVEDGVLHVKTSPVEKIYVLMEGRNCYKKVAKPGGDCNGSLLCAGGQRDVYRVTCQDGRGLRADSNAYELNGKEPVLRTYKINND